jgi:hypothetical protein
MEVGVHAPSGSGWSIVRELRCSLVLSSPSSTSRRRLYCSGAGWPVAEPIRRFWGDSCFQAVTGRRACSLWANRRLEFRTPIPEGAYRAVRAQRVGRRRGDRALGILGVGEGSRRRTAPSPRSGRGRAGSLARSGTRRIRECGPARATATAPSRIEAISIQLAEFASVGPECGPAFAAAAGRRSNRRVDRAYRAPESAKARSVGG